ncbi:hypothetical protein, partial [Frankia sp. CiP3]|uniref:hypothetical protein n=1 Tax=Frankia sp. CiP3 TaxID=2880971 RepID=UPI001EF60269
RVQSAYGQCLGCSFHGHEYPVAWGRYGAEIADLSADQCTLIGVRTDSAWHGRAGATLPDIAELIESSLSGGA